MARAGGERPEWTQPPWGLQRSAAPLAWYQGETEAQSGRGPARDGPRCPPPAQAERPFPPAHAPGSNTELQNKQAAAPAATAADGWPEGLAVLTDGRPSCVGQGRGPRGRGHRRTFANWGLASPHPETLRGWPTRRTEPRVGQCPAAVPQRAPGTRQGVLSRVLTAFPGCPAVSGSARAPSQPSALRLGRARPPEAVVSPRVCQRATTGPAPAQRARSGPVQCAR